MKLEPIVKQGVEKILMGILYEEKTLELIETTMDQIKTTVGEDYVVAYTKDDDDVNTVKFLLAKKGSNGEYTVWTVEVGPAKWEVSPEDEPTTTNENGDPPPTIEG